MLSAIKKLYSRPFLKETRSPAEIVFYRLLSAAIWPVYRIRYRRALRQTRTFIQKAAKEITEKKKSAFVFANGPSMKDIDLGKIRNLCESGGFDLIAINSYLSNSADEAPPTYAVFADNVHFAVGDTQYAKDIETCERLGIPYFAPAKYVDGNNLLRLGYCSICNIDNANTSDITKPAGYYGVTAFFALSLAKMLGYETIYICGFDNSYFRDFEVGGNGEMFIRHKHYYDEEERDTLVKCLYETSSDFFFDTYRHFRFLEKISRGARMVNIAKKTYVSAVTRGSEPDVFKGLPSG